MPDAALGDDPPRPAPRAADDRRPTRLTRVGTLALSFVGGSLALVFLASPFPSASVPIGAALFTATYAARGLLRAPVGARWRRARRAIGALSWVAIGLGYALFLYLSVAWGSLLFWTVPAWGWAVVVGSLAAVLVTARPSWRGVRVPLVVPVGAWIALCLLGWRVEETKVRCDDYHALAQLRDVRLVEPSRARIERCRHGEVLPNGRFPRVIWQAPSSDRLIVTSQLPIGSTEMPDGRFTGSVCEVRGGEPPRCVGEGTVQGLVEAVALERLFLANWGRWPGDVRGHLLAIPRSGPLELVGSSPTRHSMVGLFYDVRADRIYGFTDEGGEVLPFVASTLAAEAAVSVPIFPPHRARYDQELGEGVLCATGGPLARMDGEHYMALAIRGDPLSFRPLGTGMLPLATLSWGCDWDPAGRTAYVVIPNLGLLATIDYDTGEVQRTDFVGFGMRSITVDAQRRTLYLTNFLAGYVSAIDRATGTEVARWYVGRFPRFTTISRDGGTLFVGTNLGVVAIGLEPSP